jgi:hypothetical protein
MITHRRGLPHLRMYDAFVEPYRRAASGCVDPKWSMRGSDTSSGGHCHL